MNTPLPSLNATLASYRGDGINPSRIGFSRAAGPFIPVEPFEPIKPANLGDEAMSLTRARGILALAPDHNDDEIAAACSKVLLSAAASEAEKHEAANMVSLLVRDYIGWLTRFEPNPTHPEDASLGWLLHG